MKQEEENGVVESPTSSGNTGKAMQVPFFRPAIEEAEIEEVSACLRSGWLTSGPRTKQFEEGFAAAVGGKYALAVNSCTAALHLAVEALGLKAGQAVLVPTMTFAATAEIVRYLGAAPLLVDCDPVTLNMDLADAARRIADLRAGRTHFDPALQVTGIIPVHVGGLMLDMGEVKAFAEEHGLWIVEDAAHAFPAAYRRGPDHPWRRCGENSAAVTCFSFYANKTITTGEGGMAVTDNEDLAARMRQMSLHGLSHDAWKRYSGNSAWDYRIVAAGFKYNMTDIAAAIGNCQLRRAEPMRCQREAIARKYFQAFADLDHLELPIDTGDRIHAWHLFPIRLNLDKLKVDRNQFMDEIRRRGAGCSVHWRPLHLHPYYEENFGWRQDQFPVASAQWTRIISLPLFPGMSADEQDYVVRIVQETGRAHYGR
jgi:dTDP-4-amino-4,6-dideoxygalactose transaminase